MEKNQLKKDEEVVFNLKIKLNKIDVLPESPGDKDDSKPSVNKPVAGIPQTGGRNAFLILLTALLIIIIGVYLYKKKDNKSKIAGILVFVFVTTLLLNNIKVQAAEILINEEFTHIVNLLWSMKLSF